MIILALLFYFLPLFPQLKMNEGGVWRIKRPGVETIYLPHQAGPAIWLYLGGHLIWHGEAVRSEPARRVVPVVTPPPVRVWLMALEQA